MKLRSIAAAVSAFGISLGAQAGGGTINPAPSASFANTVYGAFEDTWTFDLGSESIVAASLTNVEVTFGSFSTGGILDFAAWLNGTQIYGPTSSVTVNGVTVKTQVLAGAGQFGPGANFQLKVSGSGITGQNASYGGNLVATPVPEPETYALMLAGLGAIGFLARRRNSV